MVLQLSTTKHHAARAKSQRASVDMQHIHSPGRLAKTLESADSHFHLLLKIESILDIDLSFPAPKNLVETLLELLPHLEPLHLASQWLDVMQYTAQTNEARTWPRTAKTGPDRNPLNRNFTRYPICAYLLQDGHFKAAQQTLGLKLLFLNALLRRNSSDGLISHAIQLRVSTRTNTDDLQILLSLPEFTGEFFNYYQQLRDSVQLLITTENQSPLLSSLRTLLELAPAARPAQSTKSRAQFEPEVAKPVLTSASENTQTPAKNISSLKLDSGNAESSEPPEFIDVFSAVLYADNTNDENELDLISPQLLDESAADSQAQTSEYWLRRHHRLVPTDWGRFTRIERKHLAHSIKTGMASADAKQALSAAILGSMYVTGLSIESLLLTQAGPDQTFTNSGSYIREIQLPEGAFNPSPEQLSDLQPKASRIILQLPEPVRQWISTTCTGETKPLGELLNLQQEEAVQLIRSLLHEIRQDGLFQRIRLERIPAALALETTLAYQDPLVTYLVAATANQAPPKLSYYAAYPVEMIQQIYSQVTQEMLNP